MDDLPPGTKILKSLIAPARYSDGPTLYLICQADDHSLFTSYEQMPDGACHVWPDTTSQGVKQAEGIIYEFASRNSATDT
jgi:hypothetical protein